MAQGFGKFDDSDFQAFVEQFDNVVQGEQLLRDIETGFKRITGMTLNIVKKKTPVGQYTDGRKGGTLRRNWNAGNIQQSGGNLSVEIYNGTEYAMHVEYGHRTRLGVTNGNNKYYKPKQGGIGYVKGEFMLQRSIEELQTILDQVMEETFAKALGRLFE